MIKKILFFILVFLVAFNCEATTSSKSSLTTNKHSGKVKVSATAKTKMVKAHTSKKGKNSPHHHSKKKSHRRVATHSNSARKSKYMVGIASYYGENDGFNGRKMANGQVFNTEDIHSAAHPTLPLGTKLLVTNESNGRSIYVEVRDRMPKEGRVIDLSSAAASYLGMHKRGLTHVVLKKVDDRSFEKNKHYLTLNDNDSGNKG
jgi:rare lipoprotein A